MTPPIIAGLALRDDDAAPLAFAHRLARAAGAPVVLATALRREAPARFPTPEYARAIREDAAERLAATAGTLDGVEVTTRVLDGSRAGELHGLAEQLGAAAIVVGSSHRGAVGRLFVGDVAVGLLHGASCPVAVVPRGYDERPHDLRSIGVAFDGTAEGEAALDAAIGLARRIGGVVHSYTVLEPVQWAPSYAWPGPYPTEEMREAREEWAQKVAARALEAIPQDVLGTSEVVRGLVVPTLAETTRGLDVLVCGSRGYGAMRSVAAGSVGRGLAHEATCPLFVVPREMPATGSSLWPPADAVEAG